MSTCLGQFLCPSSGFFQCTHHSNSMCLTEWEWTGVPSWSCPKAVYKPIWHKPLLCVQWGTPDDGQRNCPHHAEFHSKNKFEKLVYLVGFIVRIYYDARSQVTMHGHMDVKWYRNSRFQDLATKAYRTPNILNPQATAKDTSSLNDPNYALWLRNELASGMLSKRTNQTPLSAVEPNWTVGISLRSMVLRRGGAATSPA
jgi:hypothetical protein